MSVPENYGGTALNVNDMHADGVDSQIVDLNWLEQLLTQATALHQDGKLAEAELLYQKIIQKVPTQPTANHNLGLIVLRAGDVAASLILFKVALEAAPEESQYWLSYIEALLKAGQLDEADLVLTYGIDSGLQGEAVDALRLKLASTKALLLDASPAVVELKNNGKPSAAEIDVLVTLFNQGDLVGAEHLAFQLTTNFPQHGVGWKVLGAIHQRQGLLADALHDLKVAVELLPYDSEAQYNLGNCFYDQQQLDEAVISYKKAIKLNPSFARAHYNLGNVYKNQGRLKLAEASYRKALKLDANSAQMHCNLAQVLYEQGDLSAAQASYKQVLKLQADFSPAYVGLGAVFKAMGRLQESGECFRHALSINPNDVDANNNLGDVLSESGQYAEAERCYRAVLAISPDSAVAYNKLGLLLKSMGKWSDAVICYNKSLAIDPLYAEAYNNYGLALAEQCLYEAADACYQKALEIEPDYWIAYNNLGLTLHGMGRFSEAESAYNKAIELNPTQALVLSNLSLTLAFQGRIKSAEDCLKKAIALAPDYTNAYINLCTTYLAQGRAMEAEAACLHALQIEPGSTKAQSNLLFSMNYSGSHSADYRLEQARQYDRIIAPKVDGAFTSWPYEPHPKRLRVGLVSGDLRQHPVAYFLENLVQHIDSSRVELIAYLTDRREDEATARLKPYFSGWKSLVGLSDKGAAQLIHDDGLHVLLDLSGHTSGNRLPVFAWKPAPIQVSWLGYFATTGMSAMDYFIADKVGVPESNQAQFVEKIKYLPDTRLCFTAPAATVKVSSLPALVNGYVTLGSFQTMVKADDDVLALWAEVMLALPNSRLRWQCKSFADPVVADDLRLRLARYGIHSDRVVLLGSVSREAYLAAHAEVDVILDTFPFPGGTTTCEALWMGVPTLTLAGDTLIARQGASLLTAAGLSDWVAQSKTDYVNKALLFTGDLTKLANLRRDLRAQVLASPLFDAARFAGNMEAALWDMWYESGAKK